ncbi:MAG: serine hydrolase, partial [Gemmatimonadetes bacterium]|nr:serine hydrolase [Gemmatimonadota bacterium]
MTDMRAMRTGRGMTAWVLTFGAAAWLAGAPPAAGQGAPRVDPAAVDAVFRAFDNTSSPGCVVGVTQDGRLVLQRAYGMAGVAHDVRNTPASIMEPGSVAKQFTAAAVVLLALDGKLSLDDDVHRWFPELPDYGEPVKV